MSKRNSRTNGSLWCLLAYQSVCWPPGFLSIASTYYRVHAGNPSSSFPTSPKLLRLLYNPAISALLVILFHPTPRPGSFSCPCQSTAFSSRCPWLCSPSYLPLKPPLNHTLEQPGPRFIHLVLKPLLYTVTQRKRLQEDILAFASILPELGLGGKEKKKQFLNWFLK